MKTFKTIVFIVAGVLAGTVGVLASDEMTNATSGSSIIVVKAEKELVGGEVLVYNSDQILVATQKMKKRKLAVDFSQARFGAYTIVIVKGDQQKEFYFLKK
jgi:hypothetical protein